MTEPALSPDFDPATATDAIVAALDGSDHDDSVIDWAADSAARTATTLLLVSVLDPGVQFVSGYDAVAMVPQLGEELEAGARTKLDDALDRARSRHADLAIEVAAPVGAAAAVLLDIAKHARALVVGSPSKRRFERVVLGSVAQPVIAHATCPVIVVPNGYEVGPIEHVAVGVDGSEPSAHALALGMRIANTTGAALTIILGWSVEVIDGVVVTEPGSEKWQKVIDKYVDIANEALGTLTSEYPNVDVMIDVHHADSATSIIDGASAADLVAVGRRGRGGVSGLLLGSVSSRVIAQVDAVVAVVS